MFDRFDICEAYLVLEWNWHVSGVLQERKSNQRRKMSTDFQLRRMDFKPSPMLRSLGYRALTDNGKMIYNYLRRAYGLVVE